MFHVKHKLEKVHVSRETLDNIEAVWNENHGFYSKYADLVLKWNNRVNLVSRELTTRDILLHIRHSLTISCFDNWCYGAKEVFDAGSGGGLPGIPLSKVCISKVTLVDVVSKKLLAVQQICRELELANVSTIHSSIENLSPGPGDIYVSKHAFKIPDFLKLTRGQSYDRAYFLKGRDFLNELDVLTDEITVRFIPLEEFHVEPFYIDKYVIEIKNPTL